MSKGARTGLAFAVEKHADFVLGRLTDEQQAIAFRILLRVTSSLDHTARVWDAGTGKPLSPPLPHQARVVSAAFSPDGTRVVTASWDKTGAEQAGAEPER